MSNSVLRGRASRSLALTLATTVAAIIVGRRIARRRRYIDLRDKVVLVTGGSRGLGLVLARELIDAGAKVALCAREENELERARTTLGASSAELLTLTGDVADRHSVDAMLARVQQQFGPIDVLINNAGVIQVGPIEEMKAEDYDDALRVHFWGPLFTTLGVLPEMRRRRAGRIVNIASVGGKISVPHLLPYSASKFALVGFSEGLRGALARHRIYVTTVCPGLMRTGSQYHAWFKGQHRKEFAWVSILGSLPLVSVSATRAARRILEACQYGDAELVMPRSTTAAVKLYGLFPGFSAGVMSAVERFLPDPGGIGTSMRRGAESSSAWSPSVLTTLGDRAAARNNELAG